MNKIEKIGIAGIGPFKKGVVLPIVPGVQILYGKNELKGGNANAVGKSLLGKALLDIFYEPEIRGDKRQGRRFVTFSKGGKKVKVMSKDDSMTLLEDGKDISGRTKTATKKAAADLWGLTQDEFLTYGLVDAAVPHPLVKGNTAARKAFFTSFFGLDQMDREKKLFVKELAEIKKMKAAHAELTTAFAAARSDMLGKKERTALQEELQREEERLQTLLRLQEKAAAAQRVSTFLSLAKDKLKHLDKVRAPKVVKQALAAARAAEEQQNEYEEYVADKRRYIKLTEGLDLKTPMRKLEEAAEELYKIRREITLLEDVDEPTRKVGKKVAKPEEDKDELLLDLRKAKHALQHSEQFAEGKCETCGQPVKAEDAGKIRKRISKIQQQLDAWDEYESWKSLAASIAEEQDAYDKASQQLEKLRKQEKVLAPLASLHKKRAALPEKPRRVEKPDRVYDTEALKKELELSLFREQNEELIEEAKSFKPVEFDPSELTDTQERVYEIRAKLKLHKTVKARAVAMRERLQEIAKATARQQELELIIDSYSDKAMKRMAIESISKHLMDSVNKYAAMVFEDYSFEFVWGTQIQMLVRRPTGVSDVRKLSGAESLLFTLILILSQLIFVPSSKRINLLVLDEPTASFSKETEELFIKLLAHITQVIPSVLIITPKKDFRVDGATAYTLVKQHGGTVLREGHPDV